MKKEITVDDVVNLIIDKKIKEVDDLISEKKLVLNQLIIDNKKESIEHIKKVFIENFEERGLSFFLQTLNMSMGGMRLNMFGGDGGDDSRDYIYERMYHSGLSSKNSKYDKIYKKEDELEELENTRSKIRNSRERLKIEITLQRISSIDVNFDKKLEELADRIFHNKQLN